MFAGPQMALQSYPNLKSSRFFFGCASVLFYIPIIREIIIILGGREITKKTTSKILEKTGYSICLLPGGIYEQINTRYNQERHYVQKKLGFIKLAITLGLEIVPMYGFGENQLFTTHDVGHKFRHWLLKNFRIGIPFITGRFGITLIPHPTRLTHVYGIPIKVTQAENPSEEQILEVYDLYKAECERIFNSHSKELLPNELAANGFKVIRIGVDEDDRSPSQGK